MQRRNREAVLPGNLSGGAVGHGEASLGCLHSRSRMRERSSQHPASAWRQNISPAPKLTQSDAAGVMSPNRAHRGNRDNGCACSRTPALPRTSSVSISRLCAVTHSLPLRSMEADSINRVLHSASRQTDV